jgi:Bacterial DNA polymerase III alpha subunit finger domain
MTWSPLGLVRLDISPSAAMATVCIESEPDEATEAAAWRLLEAGDTLGVGQVESVGFRMLLKRGHELAELQSQHGRALTSIEDLAQLLALWKPGVYSREREDAYFDARFASRERPAYPHPAMAAVLDATYGQVLYAVMWTFVSMPPTGDMSRLRGARAAAPLTVPSSRHQLPMQRRLLAPQHPRRDTRSARQFPPVQSDA